MSYENVDIIISTYRRGNSIDPTISSIRKSQHTNFTLRIIDQSEDERTARCVADHMAEDERVRYYKIAPHGLSFARNYGASLGTSPSILFTNDDCLISPEWVGAMVAELRKPGIELAFGRVLAPPDCQCATGSGQCKEIVLALKDATQREIYWRNRFNLGFGHGHNMGMRRTLFKQLNGFDELLGAGTDFGSWDDLDFGYRVLRADGQIVYVPEALVYHCHSLDWKGVRLSYHKYGIGAGATVAKYMRCGDLSALYLLLCWIGRHGLRQILSGLLKQHSWGKTRVGISQLFYPWLGFARGFRQPVDCSRVLFRPISPPLPAPTSDLTCQDRDIFHP